MLTNPSVVKQKLLLDIERLPEYKLQEVLDFVEFLLFKQRSQAQLASQADILEGLSQIRERVRQTYGVYQGDLLAEARAEREQQINLIYGLD
jgi:hypothetical protein